MRVLHVISGLRASAGGTVAALRGLALAQKNAGADIAIFATFIAPEQEEADAMRKLGFDIHQVGPCRDPMSRHPQTAEKANELTRQCDVVHIHGLWEQIQHEAAKAARQARCPYVFSPHGMLDPWSLSQGKWKKKLYLALRLKRNLNHAAAIHYATAAEQDLAARLRLRPASIVEGFGVNMEEFAYAPQRGTFRRAHQISPDARVVLLLSRLHPKKGLDLLIPAAAQVLRPQDRLVLAGNDEAGYADQIKAMLGRAGMTDRTILTGWLDHEQRLAALVDSDLMALPSYQENFGLAVIEALALGIPVVISDQVNLWREISREKLGAVVPTQVVPLAAALRTWLGDESLRRDVAERGPAFVRERFEWSGIGQRWLGYYKSLGAG